MKYNVLIASGFLSLVVILSFFGTENISGSFVEPMQEISYEKVEANPLPSAIVVDFVREDGTMDYILR